MCPVNVMGSLGMVVANVRGCNFSSIWYIHLKWMRGESLIFSRYAIHDEYRGCTCVGDCMCWFNQHSSGLMSGGAV
jgi:hypothetical protein